MSLKVNGKCYAATPEDSLAYVGYSVKLGANWVGLIITCCCVLLFAGISASSKDSLAIAALVCCCCSFAGSIQQWFESKSKRDEILARSPPASCVPPAPAVPTTPTAPAPAVMGSSGPAPIVTRST